MSPSSDAALAHLRHIKPNDGWAIEQKSSGGLSSSKLMRLLRRNVPVTDSFFLDIYHDASTTHQVVGVLTTKSSNKSISAQVLVDSNGRPVTAPSIVTVTGYPAVAASTAKTPSTSTTATPSSTRHTIRTKSTTIPDAQNRELLVYGAGLLGVAIASRLLASSMLVLVVLVPLVYLYLASTCPNVDTFDPKKELKRILRGHYLPDHHPEKPKGLLSETLARISASVTTELATLPGYQVTTIQLAGAAIVACARVPSVQTDYYWIGIHHHWYYLYGTKIE